ncbi:MAG: histidinol-phosphate transaminase [Nitrososphaerota archaeon]|nr:histidinol-phosphate transaminase [Candidatus Bathyarchaeota archaeon]MDW8022310.1 histidinol-phosphate transaminase [Nitrososphaerota archaeon]
MKVRDAEWFRRKIEAVQPIGYVFGDTVKSVELRFGVERSKIVKLDANENFFIPREKLVEIIVESMEEVDPRLYPQEELMELRERLSAYVKVPADFIAIGNGSDELMERVARLFLESGEQALTFSPTFSMYRHAVCLQKAELLEVPLKEDFSLDAENLLSKTSPKTRVLFLCSPNNPTANQFKTEELEYLIEKFPGIVVVDEAYVEFAGDSIVQLTKKFENLIVLRTFSKAFGLAGLRLGYCVADAEIAGTLSKNVGLPYPVNTIAIRVGAKILEKKYFMEKAVEQLKAEREKLVRALNGVEGVKAFESQTNFLLFKTEKPSAEVYHGLLERGIVVRNLGTILKFNNCFRATVGLPSMNVRLVEALREICALNRG